MDKSQVISIKSCVEEKIKSFSFEHFGFARLERPLSMSFYKEWINKGYQGDMQYLATHQPQKENPGELLNQAQSAIVIAQNYFPHPKPIEDFPVPSLNIATYAQGEDYHFWFKSHLSTLAKSLKQEFPKEEFLAFTDSSPVLERDLAYRAGLGWVGKNTCLIDQKRGSLFFIGEIYTTLKFNEYAALHPDRCGKCTRCIDACPTDALVENKTLDANKCISYLNIESKTLPAEELRGPMGSWFFGCDICQTVCPWNEKVFGPELKQAENLKSPREDIIKNLKWILTSSNNQLAKNFKSSALSRAGGRGLKRNALIVAVNLDLKELVPSIKVLTQSPQLKDLALWALEKLNS